jgi:hypothetical protein
MFNKINKVQILSIILRHQKNKIIKKTKSSKKQNHQKNKIILKQNHTKTKSSKKQNHTKTTYDLLMKQI